MNYIVHIALDGGYMPSWSEVYVLESDRASAPQILEILREEIDRIADGAFTVGEDPELDAAWDETLAEVNRDIDRASDFAEDSTYLYDLPPHEHIEAYPITDLELETAGWKRSSDGYWESEFGE